MPRRPRCYLPGHCYHIVQRGNNREACFIEPENYQYYLELWQRLSLKYGVSVHAYCLMINHIHFLVTPEDKTAISNTMKVVGSRYAQYFNKKYRRSGTLWEGRHKSSLVQEDRYLLTCYRYIEMNPVRAQMVQRPDEYKWSSYSFNAWGDDSWLLSHPVFLELGSTLSDCHEKYRSLIQQEIAEQDIEFIRKAAHYSQPFGDERFSQEIEGKYGLKAGQMKRGRPRSTMQLYKK